MSALLRAFSGFTVGLGGSVIGIRWSLAISAGVLFAVTALFLVRSGAARFVISPGKHSEPRTS